MKKFFYLLILVVILFALGSEVSHAQTIQAGQACSTANGSDGNCAGYLICTSGTCQPDPNLDNGTGAAGQPCQPSASNCSTGLICDSTDTCSASGSSSAGQGSVGTTAGAGIGVGGTAGAGVSTGSNFVPLTALPGVNTVAQSTNFIALFNNLYKICIGLAAILALLQIIWAGVIWMMAGDSSEKVSQATKKIQSAVFGLLLVLSPVIVFGIINPNVLSLNLNVSALSPTAVGNAAGTTLNSGAAGSTAGAGLANTEPGVQTGQTCSTAGGSDGNCAGNLICTNGTCQTDPQLDNGNGSAGQPCQPSASNCSAGLICDSTDTCNAPAGSSAAAGASTASSGSSLCFDGSPGPNCQACMDGSTSSTGCVNDGGVSEN